MTRPEPAPSSRGERLFAVLLRAYPRAFRARYHADLLDAFRRDRGRARFQGLVGALRFWCHTVKDVARTGWSERRAEAERSAADRRPTARVVAGFARDVTLATRTLGRQKTFALVAISTLGLGIGSLAAVFAVVDRVLLTPLPYPEPDRLVRVYEYDRNNPEARMVAYGNYARLGLESNVFSSLSIWGYDSQVLTGVGDARTLSTRGASANIPTTFETPPALGRWFTREEEDGGAHVLVLSHRVWHEMFGGDARAIGRSVRLDGAPFEIIGVMPAGFDFPTGADGWHPLAPVTDAVGQWRWHRHSMVGRLAPGVSPALAGARLDVVAADLERLYPDYNKANYFEATPLLESLVGRQRGALVVMLAAVAVLLAIACANVASLFLVRAISRAREFAMRSALGASWGQLASLVLAETAVLAVLGIAAGLLLANAAVPWLLALAGGAIPRANTVEPLSARVALVALAASAVCALAVAVVPVWRGRSLRTPEALAAIRDSRTVTSRATVLGRRVLVAVQLGLAFGLATSAGMLTKSFARLERVDTGVVSAGVMTFDLQLSAARYAEPVRIARAVDELVAQFERIPGVVKAGMTLTAPVDETGWYNSLTIRGREVPMADLPHVSFVPASGGYLETLQVPILRGRVFGPSEPLGEDVAVINRVAAARYWPDSDPLGALVLGSTTTDQGWARVIGVVDNVRQSLSAPVEPQVFVPIAQAAVNQYVVMLRTSGDPRAVVPAARGAVTALDPDIPISGVMLLDERIGRTLAAPRFNAALLSVFAGLSVLLGAAGVFGVVSYSVADRRREFGIRLAVGASRARVMGLVLRDTLSLVLAASALGLGLSALAARAFGQLLPDITTFDPGVVLVVAAMIATTTVVASVAPARLATRADPLATLRES